MARAYGGDLRRKLLSAYDEGEETLAELADRFRVSLGWAKRFLRSITMVVNTSPRR